MSFLEEIENLAEDLSNENLLLVLQKSLEQFGCVVGSIHFLDQETRLLQIKVHQGIPEAVLPMVQTIPIGKGMAGLAAERLEPFYMCNLQTDDSGDAKPAAKQTEMAGSAAFPILHEGKLMGTMGVAKPQEYEYSRDELDLMIKIGNVLGRKIAEQ